MIRDHVPYIATPTKGLYARGDRVSPPDGYLSRATNVIYSSPALSDVDVASRARVREDFKFVQSLSAIAVRFYVYTKSTGNRIIFLDQSGNFIDASTGLTILTIVGCFDFHGITINDRFFFTPHDRETGLSGQYVYIYDPALSATARKIGGDPATGVFTVASSAVAGSIEPGKHIIAISNITNTGFITKPALHVIYTAPNPRKKVSLTAIPLGPANVVARIIWMSQVLIGWDGNLTGPELFEAYRIENNTTIVLNDTVDKFDGQLIASADAYTDTLTDVPAGTYLTDLDGRLVTCGSFANKETVYISNPNEPENVDSVDGLRIVTKNRGGGVRTTRPLRGNLVCWKKNMTAIIRPNSDPPNLWPVDVVDESIGSEVYGVSEALNNSNNMFYDTYIVANQMGVTPFNGTYVDVLKPLTWPIESLWFRLISLSNLNTVKVIVDPIHFRFYVLLTDKDGIVQWLMGDFSEGMTADTMQWSDWNFTYTATFSKNFIDAHIVVNPDINKNDTTILAIVDDDIGLRELVTNTYSTGADYDGDINTAFGVKISDPEFRDIHLGIVRLICAASAANSIGQYEVQVADQSFPFLAPTENGLVIVYPNVTAPKIEVIITAQSADLDIAAIILYTQIVALERGI